jgi:hypothetical protein
MRVRGPGKKRFCFLSKGSRIRYSSYLSLQILATWGKRYTADSLFHLATLLRSCR